MKKDRVVHFRCTQKEKNRIIGLAKIYAGGNISQLILDWIIDGPARQFVKKKKPRK